MFTYNPFNIPEWRRHPEAAATVEGVQAPGVSLKQEVTCDGCGQSCVKNSRDVRFRKRRNMQLFCSRACARRYFNKVRHGISEVDIQQIRHYRQKKFSSYKIAELTGHARNTVMKYW